jgi:hypothetical protein
MYDEILHMGNLGMRGFIWMMVEDYSRGVVG